MKKAVVDLGTNTFNLLIASVQGDRLNILENKREAVMLGMGGINDQLITPEAMNRAEDCMKNFKQICDYWNVESIEAVGTSAMRDARNGNDLIHRIKQSTGISIQVIDGTKEAAFIYEGVRNSCKLSASNLIMDIGGGSTELILCSNTEVNESESFDIGVSRIYQHFNCPNEISEALKVSIEEYMNDRSSVIDSWGKCSTLIGSSGSYETFYELLNEEPFDPSKGTVSLDLNELNKVLDWCIFSGLEERMEHQWIVPIRKKMLPIAAIQVKWIIDLFSIEEVFLSPYSMKEGVLFS